MPLAFLRAINLCGFVRISLGILRINLRGLFRENGLTADGQVLEAARQSGQEPEPEAEPEAAKKVLSSA